MRTNDASPRSACRATAVALGLAVVLCAGEWGSPAFAASPMPHVLPAVGKTLHYRITRTVQGNTGPKSGISNVTLHRKSATSLTVKGVFDHPSVLAALTVGSDGLLEISEKDKDAAGPSLGDVVDGLNRLTGLFAGRKNAPSDGWSAPVRVAGNDGTQASVAIPIAVVNAHASDFELHGVGEVTIQAKAPPAFSNAAGLPPGFGRANRFRPGGGFAGDALPGALGAPLAARQSVNVAVSVDARIHHGTVSKIAIVETRSITLDAVPYVNVSGWTIEASK